MRAPCLRNRDVGHDEGLTKALVVPLRNVARQLDVLTLVVAHRNEVRPIQQDVGRHQHRVGEEAGGDEVLLSGAILELRHPPKFAEAGHGAEQPGRFRVGGDVALEEDGRAVGVEPGGEEQRCQVERRLVQLRRLKRSGDRVEVDDAEERLALLLRRRILAKAAAVVAEVSSRRMP